MIQIADAGNTGGRPARDPRVQNYCARALSGLLLMQNTRRYAGDDPDARPVPKRTLGSFKRELSSWFDAVPLEPSLRGPTALHFAFCSDKIRFPLEDVIPVRHEDLWWLAAPNDLILVSDGVTPHYTTVNRVTPEDEKIYLLDDWPDRIFLIEGRNSRGIRAEVIPYFAGIFDDVIGAKQEVCITRTDYEKVIVGLITQDTPALLERYFAHRPQARSSCAINLSSGLTLLDARHGRIALFAVPYLERALGLAREQADEENENRAASALYVALLVSAQRARELGEPLAEKPFEEYRLELEARYGETRLLESMQVDHLCWLGDAAGAAENFDAAQRYLDIAVSREAGHERALGLRAKVYLRRGNAARALDDATGALEANSRRTREVEAHRDARDRRDQPGRMNDDAVLGGLRHRRGDQHLSRATALLALGRVQEARYDAQQAVECAPELAGGYLRLAGIEQNSGNFKAAAEHVRQAIAREKNPGARATFVGVLQALEAAPPSVEPSR
jgi:tetratricopeptide (TPR) repeat protein